MAEHEVQRLGVVALVPEPAASAIDRWRRELDPVNARIVPPHVTVLGPVEVPTRDWAALEAHLAEVAARTPPIDVHLSGTESFRPDTETAFVSLASGSDELSHLSRALNAGPLTHEARFAYHPHVTIATDVPPEVVDRAVSELATFDAAFTVDRVGLFKQSDIGVWAPTGWFALGG